MINIVQEPDGWYVWHDSDGSPEDGVCIGAGQSKQLALFEAKNTLEESIREVQSHIEPIIGALANALANDVTVADPDPGFPRQVY